MRVCMLSTVHSASDIRIVQKEASCLAAAGHDVTVVAREPALSGGFGGETRLLTFPQMSRWKRPLMAGRAASSLVHSIKPEVLHFHDPELIPVAFALRRSIGCRLVYDVHEDVPADIYSKNWIPRPFQWSVARAMELIERYSSIRFDAIVAATPEIAARFREYGAKVFLVQNFAREEEFPTRPPDAERKRQAVYIGQISFNRGLVEMVEACRQASIALVLAGIALPDEEKWLAAHGRDVDWRGTIGRKEVAELLNESMVGFCLFHPDPNHLHAMPTKLFEYMAAGLPIITSDLPRSRELVEFASAGLVAPKLEPQVIASLLSALSSDRGLIEKMGASGRAAMLQHFCWTNEERSLEQLYAVLASG